MMQRPPRAPLRGQKKILPLSMPSWQMLFVAFSCSLGVIALIVCLTMLATNLMTSNRSTSAIVPIAAAVALPLALPVAVVPAASAPAVITVALVNSASLPYPRPTFTRSSVMTDCSRLCKRLATTSTP